MVGLDAAMQGCPLESCPSRCPIPDVERESLRKVHARGCLVKRVWRASKPNTIERVKAV